MSTAEDPQPAAGEDPEQHPSSPLRCGVEVCNQLLRLDDGLAGFVALNLRRRPVAGST
jgi:hypothetical protein